MICAAGAGKVQPSCPQGEPLTVRYHSGAVLDLWEVEIPEETPKAHRTLLCVIPLPMERFTNMTRTRSK